MEFSYQENDSTDLTAMADGLVRNCSRLQNIHIASTRLSHAVVLAITAASLRFVSHLLIVVVGHVHIHLKKNMKNYKWSHLCYFFS